MTRMELNTRFINNDLLPVCAWCGSVRDKQNKWQKLSLKRWKSLNLTHGICPDCTINLF